MMLTGILTRAATRSSRRWSGGRILGGVALSSLLLGMTGCLQQYLDDEFVIGPRQVEIDTSELSPTLLADRIQEIDNHYAEPRTPARVALSLETSLISISPVNDYEALWRGIRACSWLAKHYPSPSARKQYALRGVALGQQARAKISSRVESYYYTAQCQLALIEQGYFVARPTYREAEERLKIAVALDPSFDHCGPHRALGKLLLAASERALVSRKGIRRTRLSEALDHVSKAVESCPEYGENRLALAQASIARQDYETARASLEEVLVSGTPEDSTAAHQRWLEEANGLLMDLAGK